MTETVSILNERSCPHITETEKFKFHDDQQYTVKST